jgi:hypothetical protein
MYVTLWHLHAPSDHVERVGGALGQQACDAACAQPRHGGHICLREVGFAGPVSLESVVRGKAEARVWHDPEQRRPQP